MPIKVFWAEQTEYIQIGFRRYDNTSRDDRTPCPGKYGYHNAEICIGEFKARYDKKNKALDSWDKDFSKSDPRWPTHCQYCDYEFLAQDYKQVNQEQIYRRGDNGEEITLRNRIPGMMWDSWWMPKRKGHDGLYLNVVLPSGGEWTIDSRASNCDSPCKNCGKGYDQHVGKYYCTEEASTRDVPRTEKRLDVYSDSVPEHRCWVRHGDPRTGFVHVDKNGLTCGAGKGREGSLRRDDFWGYLHNGFLITEDEYAAQKR
jgi:hypothetical protein